MVDAPLTWDTCTGLAAAVPPGTPAAKAATTRVSLIRADAVSGTSLVRALPLTGRTHQIRVHLAHQGFPIANDRDYGGRRGLPRAQWLVRRRGDGSQVLPSCAHFPVLAPLDSGRGQ